MIDLIHLGQGPRPDLLEKELRREAKIRESAGKDGTSDGNAVENLTHEDCADGKPAKKKKRTEFEGKDAAAIIIALFQLLLPWLAAGVGIFFLAVLLISKL